MPSFKHSTTGSSSEFTVLIRVSRGMNMILSHTRQIDAFGFMLMKGRGSCAVSRHSLYVSHSVVKWGEAITGNSSWSIYNITLLDCFKWIMTDVDNCQSAATLPAMQWKWNGQIVCRASHGFCRYSKSQNRRLFASIFNSTADTFAALLEFFHGVKEAKSARHNLWGLLLFILFSLYNQTIDLIMQFH
jgi:hypothetical protein